MGKRKMKTTELAKGVAKRPRGWEPRYDALNDYDLVSPCDYVTTGGFHFARPYAFEFRLTYKPRFANRTVLSVYCDEFPHVDYSYWPNEFRQGRVLSVNPRTNVASPLLSDIRWYSGLVVVHIVHRHESPVPDAPIDVVIDKDEFLVVSKPAGMPVHPSGTYRRNTLQFLLRAFPPPRVDHNGPLLIVHRLDKETSGVVILAKTSAAAARFSAEIRDHRVEKLYIAHVHGIFSPDDVVCDGCITWDNKRMRSKVDPSGSSAQTKIRRIACDARTKTSIVECRPLTGRTHQIRVHLTHLGHPIVGDTMYGGHNLTATTTTTSMTTMTRTYESSHGIIPRFLQRGLLSLASSWNGGTSAELTVRRDNLSDASEILLTDAPFEEPRELLEQNQSFRACRWAVKKRNGGKKLLTTVEEGALLECANCPQVTNVKNVDREAMQIRLHALRYKTTQWDFKAGPPVWMPDWCALGDTPNGTERVGQQGLKRNKTGRKETREDTTCGDDAEDSICVVM